MIVLCVTITRPEVHRMGKVLDLLFFLCVRLN